MEWQSIFLWGLTTVLGVGAYLYREMKAQVNKSIADVDDLHEALLNYKTFVASTYVSNDELRQAIGDMTRSVDNVTASCLRIEARLNVQHDRRQNDPH